MDAPPLPPILLSFGFFYRFTMSTYWLLFTFNNNWKKNNEIKKIFIPFVSEKVLKVVSFVLLFGHLFDQTLDMNEGHMK